MSLSKVKVERSGESYLRKRGTVLLIVPILPGRLLLLLGCSFRGCSLLDLALAPRRVGLSLLFLDHSGSIHCRCGHSLSCPLLCGRLLRLEKALLINDETTSQTLYDTHIICT